MIDTKKREKYEQTLQEWYIQEKARLEDFLEFWKKEHEKDPQNFPNTLLPGEWDEQLQIYSGK
jgi:hypothetical protein